MANPVKPLRGIPASPEKKKVLPAVPERVYDKWAMSEVSFSGPNIGTKVTGGHVRFVRYRDTESGPEEDPDGEVWTSPVRDLYNMAANPDWPEARSLLDAAQAFAERLGREQGIF